MRNATRKPPETEVRKQDWRGALITDGSHTHRVSLRALTCDESTRAGHGGSSHEKLWDVRVELEHSERAPSLYLTEQRRQFANPNDPARVTITIGCPRGQIEGDRETGRIEPVSFTLECQLGHVDALAQALSNALILGRRDGTFPVVRGMKPFSAASVLTGKPDELVRV